MRELCAGAPSDVAALRALCDARLATLARIDAKHAAYYAEQRQSQ